MTWINYGSKNVKEMYYSSNEFATQWPCPDGFHVPTKDEWQTVYDAWVALWQWNDVDWNLISVKLKLPFAGLRRRSTAEALNQGSTGYYWSSTWYSTDSAHYLYFSSSEVLPQWPDNRVYWFSIRAFRNSPLAPDTSWTTIYAWSNWSWIYHNPTEWVISISSNWTTWYTIADKNLWATTVYNDGDSLSEANCGYYYQWWNNYNFPRTWTVTTSSTKVDASAYWPWNYYSSSTFITGSSSAWDWSSVTNDNLWWWVTWSIYNIKKVKEVYYWSKKIWPVDLPSTVVCNFIANWWWTTSLDTIKSTSFSHWNSSSIASWSNWTVRYSISKTDVHAWIALWWYANNSWNNNWWVIGWSSTLKQKLIKKAYLKISSLYASGSWYPVFTPGWVYVEFSKPVISTNFTDYNKSTSTKSMAWFIYPRWDNSTRRWYIVYPIDSNTQYLALPTTPAWCWKTSTWYINQWKSCLYSRVILEVKWSNASNFHYRLTVEETWNSYDLWLCSALWSCCIHVWSWDRWMVWSYKEVSEAYLEVYDDWYITETWAISQTKPR